jgi:hypothetical protein
VKNNKLSTYLFISISAALIAIIGCRKINDATSLGEGILPVIDNIHTFETYLEAQTDNFLFNDSTKVLFTDQMALGHIGNDQDFGTTHANGYFNVSAPNYLYYPFYNRDSLVAIDSVVLSLSYQGYYGDTLSTQTLRVFEIAQNAGFNDTTLYKYSQPDFATTGAELGSKTFQIKSLKDTILHIQKRDTTKLTGVIRIRLSTAFGQRLSTYDTTNTSNGGFHSDSIFKRLFRGFAVKADNAGSSLIYIAPSDVNTKLSVYYRTHFAGSIDTTVVNFLHTTGGQANTVVRTPGGTWANYLSNGSTTDDKMVIATTPGSYTTIKIPGLDTLQNAVIHLAELKLTPLRTAQEGTYNYPLALFMDHINAARDTVFAFDKDMGLTNNYTSFSYDVTTFGGALRTDSTYRFNVSRYVQNLVTNRATSHNDVFRIFAPTYTSVYSKMYGVSSQINVTDRVAQGRIVLAGGGYNVDPSKRLRLRVVYSKL